MEVAQTKAQQLVLTLQEDVHKLVQQPPPSGDTAGTTELQSTDGTMCSACTINPRHAYMHRPHRDQFGAPAAPDQEPGCACEPRDKPEQADESEGVRVGPICRWFVPIQLV